MKEIEEIQGLGLEELEKIASDESVKVPSGLKASLEALAGAAELTKEAEAEQTAPRRPLVWAAVAVAASLAAAFLVFRGITPQPRDTFSDPYLAYAEIQKTFSRISESGEQAAKIAGNAVPAMEKTEEILNRIMK